MSTATLEVHLMNVSQGDSVLLINRDVDAVRGKILTRDPNLLPNNTEPIDYVPIAIHANISLEGTIKHALLIDGGDDDYGGDVVQYLETHGAVTKGQVWAPNLNVLVTHFHDDHFAGLRSVFKQRVEEPRVQNGGRAINVRLVERYRPRLVFYTSRDNLRDPNTARFEAFIQDVQAAQSGFPPERTMLFPLYPNGFYVQSVGLGTGVDGIPITLKVIAAAQSVFSEISVPPARIQNPAQSTIDQNDRSIVLILEYGSFRFFLGGDIAGNAAVDGQRWFSNHADMETPIAAELVRRFPATRLPYQANTAKYPRAGYCTAIKANHHGSASSNAQNFINAVQPTFAVFSVGLKTRFHGHPTQESVDRCSAYGSPNLRPVYLTECASRVKEQLFLVDLRGGRILGDIVIRPVDETIRALQQATTTGGRLQVQVYGTGAQTGLPDPDVDAVRPITTPEPPSVNAVYPLGRWIHEDVH